MPLAQLLPEFCKRAFEARSQDVRQHRNVAAAAVRLVVSFQRPPSLVAVVVADAHQNLEWRFVQELRKHVEDHPRAALLQSTQVAVRDVSWD